MAQANDSVLVTPGSGATMATHNPGDGKEYQVVMVADDSGHIQQTLPTYVWWVPTSAAGANKLYADLFNASGSGKIIEVRGVWCIPKSDTAVTATLGIEIGLYRTSAVGTGGTAHGYDNRTAANAHSITPLDTANASLPAQITARAAPTGGATIASLYWAQHIWTEETNPPATAFSAGLNLIPVGVMTQKVTLREGQGLLFKQGTVAGAGNLQFLTIFTLV